MIQEMKLVTKREIAQKLKQLRSAAGVSQRVAAEAIGRSQQTIGSWETGAGQPDIPTAHAASTVSAAVRCWENSTPTGLCIHKSDNQKTAGIGSIDVSQKRVKACPN